MSELSPQATAGRMVHFYAPMGVGPTAAVVNRDTGPEGTAELTVFMDTRPVVHVEVAYSEHPAPGCWSWMPYQKEKAKSPAGNVSESAEPRP